MKLLVALFDRATEAFAPVMTVHTRAEALRTFRQEVNNPQSPLNKHPTDYELHILGSYDDQTGFINATSELIARAEDHLEQ